MGKQQNAHGDAAADAGAVRQRLGHVVRVAGEAAADVLCQDGRAARARVLQLLQHQHTCMQEQIQGLGFS